MDCIRNIGISNTIKNLLSLRENEKKIIISSETLHGWEPAKLLLFKMFPSVPLKMLMRIFEDYKQADSSELKTGTSALTFRLRFERYIQ